MSSVRPSAAFRGIRIHPVLVTTPIAAKANTVFLAVELSGGAG
jgi:hypothetical protein